ncbi:MAG: hypothetical protein ACC645_20525 [Pirellulales bacterium]
MVSDPPASSISVEGTTPSTSLPDDAGGFCPPIGLGGRDRCGEVSCAPDPSTSLAALRPYPLSDRARLLAVPTRPVFGPRIDFDPQPLSRAPESLPEQVRPSR